MTGAVGASLAAALLAVASRPLPGRGVDEPRTVQVRAREIWTAAGQRVSDALLLVVDGRVRSVKAGAEADPELPLVVHDGVVTAGLIACHTDSGAQGELEDDSRSVMPTALAAYAFDPEHPDFERALAAGITALALTPGDENLVGGLTCVVKTAGARVLEREATLAISFSSRALGRSGSQGFFLLGAAEGGAGPTAAEEGGPELTARTQRGSREPTSYSGALLMLRKLFAEKEGPFARAAGGELPVTLEALDRHEVLRAARFAVEHDLVGAIRGAPLASDPDVVAALRETHLGVIVGPWSADQTVRSLESVRALAEAGIPVAFALDAPLHHPEELRLFAARALWAGAGHDAVFRALTSDAARLVGTPDHIGTLEPGRDADFVLWSGDPLDLSSRIEAVYVDGVRRWTAPARPASNERDEKHHR